MTFQPEQVRALVRYRMAPAHESILTARHSSLAVSASALLAIPISSP